MSWIERHRFLLICRTSCTCVPPSYRATKTSHGTGLRAGDTHVNSLPQQAGRRRAVGRKHIELPLFRDHADMVRRYREGAISHPGYAGREVDRIAPDLVERHTPHLFVDRIIPGQQIPGRGEVDESPVGARSEVR